jgi:ABC-type nitrate/sulfonate/bicarbonate transport system substrate-binding protein
MDTGTERPPRRPSHGRGWAVWLALALVAFALAGCQAAVPAPKPAGGAPDASAPGGATSGSTASTAAAPAAAPAAPRQIRVGYAAVSPRVAPLWVAAEEGFFQRRGLSVEALSMRNAAALQAAMLSHEIEMAQGGLSATLAARAAGADVVLLGGLLDTALGQLVAQPDLRRPEDLRGKRLGVQSIGGTVWTRGMLALEKLGLEPERDGISVLVIGDEPTLAQAVVAGVIDVTPVGLTASRPLQAQGYTVWDLADLGVFEIGQAMLAPGSLVREEPHTVEQFVRAMGETVAYMKGMTTDPTRRERVLGIAGAQLRMAPADTAPELDAFVPMIPRNLTLGREAMDAIYAITLRDNPELARIPLDAAVDQSLVQRLEREGFFRQLYSAP